MKRIGFVIYLLFCTCTAMIGHARHHSILWAVGDFFWAPLAWVKWLIFKQVSISTIKAAFAFFLK
jgi:hypothetical protein